ADPWAKTSSAPTSSSTSRMGSSHHFLRTRRKAQSWDSTPRLAMTSPRSELGFQVAPPPGRRRNPKTTVVLPVAQRMTSREAYQEPDRLQNHEIHHTEEARRRHA